jgi:hypothetical protein
VSPRRRARGERPKRKRTGELLGNVEHRLGLVGLEGTTTAVARFHALQGLEVDLLNRRVLPGKQERAALHEIAATHRLHVSQVAQVERRVVRRMLAILRNVEEAQT